MAANMKLRFALAGVLVVLGLALLVYGVSFHTATVQAKSGDSAPAVVASERSLVKEVTVGGVQRDADGTIRKTYSGSNAPKACPT